MPISCLKDCLPGSFIGTLTISLPVGAQYNGQTVVVLHAKQDGELETYNVAVKDGAAKFEVTSLSLFAVFLRTGLDNIPETGDAGAAWLWWALRLCPPQALPHWRLPGKKPF